MRGRRAFVILSLYLVLLAGFAWMVELIMERTYATGFGGNATFATAAIGQGIFVSILMLETLLVAFLAPMATAGAISLEREKQTLEMLAATPITSVAIVVGKLLSALIYVWLLIAASIPLTAVVFVFGGVAPDDLLHGYLVLIVTALGLGAFGLLCSSLVKRTQAASAITIFGVLALSIGSLFVILFWQALASADQGRGTGPIKGSPPAPLDLPQPVPGPGRRRPDRRPVRHVLGPALLLPVQGDVPARPERGDLRQRLRPDPTGPDRHRRRRPTSGRDRQGAVVLGPDQIKKLQILAAGGGEAAVIAASDLGGRLAARARPVRGRRCGHLGEERESAGSCCRSRSCCSPSSSCPRPVAGACDAVRRRSAAYV